MSGLADAMGDAFGESYKDRTYAKYINIGI